MASYNRYSHHARRALAHAGLLTARCHHAMIDTGHLLVGVMLARGSIGYQVLHNLQLDAAQAEPYLVTLAPRLPVAPDYFEDSPSLGVALDIAEDEASRLGHHYVGTEHFLLGITRTNVGNATTLLRLMNSTPEEVRRHVRRIITDGVMEFNLQDAKRNARLTELSRRVISASEQMAVAMDHPTVGVGHLLLVLVREQRSYTAALLQEMGLREYHLREALDEGDIALMISIEGLLDRAMDLTDRLGNHYTGTDHLLLALCSVDEGRTVLARFNLSPEDLRERVEAHMRSGK